VIWWRKNEEAGDQTTSEVERVRNLRVQKLLTDTEYRDLKQKYGNIFEAGMGADAILKNSLKPSIWISSVSK